jgi:hypothetical protein
MKTHIFATLPALVFFFLSSHSEVFSQCSDAGVCAIGPEPTNYTNEIGVSYWFAKSAKTDDITFHTLKLEGEIQVLEDS